MASISEEAPQGLPSLEEVVGQVSDDVEPFGSLLPRLFALKCVANEKYMRYESAVGVDWLGFSVGAIIADPRTRYEAELTSTEGVVHIRCTFNNKYLRRLSESTRWVKALATEKSEDTSQWDCTMFEVLPATQGAGQIRLRHVALGYYLCSDEGMLAAPDTAPSDGSDRFTFINLSSLVILPRYVAFKGPNGKYLNKGRSIPWLEFRSDDKGEAGVTMEVVPASDGNIYIRAGPGGDTSEYWMKYKDDGASIYILFVSELGEYAPVHVKSPFQVFKDEVNRISLKHLVSNKFCCYMDDINSRNVLTDISSGITQDTKLIVEEPVMRRTLEIEWRLQDARVYDVAPLELTGSTQDNNSSSPVTKEVTLAYETAVTSSFETSHTWATGITTSIETPKIPFIGGGMQIEMSAEYGGSYTWGESTTNTRSYSETDTYTIPPRTRLVVQKLSTRGYCDVPYKYVQTDYLYNGDVIRTDKEDGVYKGVNYFNIYTTNRDEPLPQSLWVD